MPTILRICLTLLCTKTTAIARWSIQGCIYEYVCVLVYTYTLYDVGIVGALDGQNERAGGKERKKERKKEKKRKERAAEKRRFIEAS